MRKNHIKPGCRLEIELPFVEQINYDNKNYISLTLTHQNKRKKDNSIN